MHPKNRLKEKKTTPTPTGSTTQHPSCTSSPVARNPRLPFSTGPLGEVRLHVPLGEVHSVVFVLQSCAVEKSGWFWHEVVGKQNWLERKTW